MSFLISIGVAAACVLLGILVFLVREQRLSRTWLASMTVASGVLLIGMVLSDWPFETLAQFWAKHSVLASLLSTVLLLALGFLAFEEAELRRQMQLDTSLTAAGLSGVVDHLVDVEVSLAMVSAESPPSQDEWESWADPRGKPLRWLRQRRDRLHRDGIGPSSSDPRGSAPSWPEQPDASWRGELIDQAVRRLSAALRDWSPVIGVSRNGRVMLVAVATVRKDLMALSELIDINEARKGQALLVELRRRCRLMAYFFETQSESYPPRPEVLRTFTPLPAGPIRAHHLGISDEGLSRRWKADLATAERALESAP